MPSSANATMPASFMMLLSASVHGRFSLGVARPTPPSWNSLL